MSKKSIYTLIVLAIILLLTWIFSNSRENNEEFTEKVKISLREVGHQLLLTNKDSTSLVLPVIELELSKYAISFEQELTFLPNDLVTIVKESFQKAELPEHYRVSVIPCNDRETAYSYEMSSNEENTIIPCSGRYLPENCYTIKVDFIDRKASFFNKKLLLVIFFIGFLSMLVIDYYKRKQSGVLEEFNKSHTSIGSFQFYPDQNKLVKEAVEINLSRKECELLELFIAKPNQIIKRDELTKKVWEDHGVIVGRSLDTYISKLRKKLKDDDSIKLTNVHGVGYKLEICD